MRCRHLLVLGFFEMVDIWDLVLREVWVLLGLVVVSSFVVATCRRDVDMNSRS